MERKEKRFVILCNYPFPEGMAPTTRIFAYAKGINKNGHKCEVLSFCPQPSFKNLTGIKNDVSYFNSHYYNPTGNKFYRVFIDLNLFRIKALLFLIKARKKQKIDYVIISFDTIKHLVFFVPILSILKFRLAFISDEYPPEIRRLRSSLNTINWFLYKLLHKHFIFRIVMTNALDIYYNTQFGYKPTFLLNTIVDTDRFLEIPQKVPRLFFNTDVIKLCYMGNLELAKDNVDNIVRAIALFRKKYSNVQLDLYGEPKERDKGIINQVIKEFNLEKNVFFKGIISSKEVPHILTNYDILVSSQPQTVRAQGGFPTKLGEYLMSGVPSLLTDVGEISNYISDGYNAYTVEPCSPELFSEKLEYIIDNYEYAVLHIAENGKKFILNNFECERATKEFTRFLSELS